MPVFAKIIPEAVSLRKPRILHSALFQREWYVSRYSHDFEAQEDPLDHYIRCGDKQGFFPNPYLDPEWYREKANITQKYKKTSLEHYLEHAKARKLSPSRLFDSKLYLCEYPDVAKSELPALAYHLKFGLHEGKCAFHARLKRDVQRKGKKSKSIIQDMKVIAASGLFNETWYLAHYMDMRNKHGEALLHYVEFGGDEDRMPNPIFSTCWYRDHYMRVSSNDHPLAHYINVGIKKGYNPAETFCSKSYKANAKQNGWRKGEDPLRHFLTHGYVKGDPWPEPDPSSLPKAKTKKNALPVHEQLRGMTDYPPKPLNPETGTFYKNRMNIHWVVPEFSAGAGGHMTICRMASILERFGHKQTIWIHNPGPKRTDETGYDDIQKYFQFFSGDVRVLDERFEDAKGDALIATDCWTVWPSLSASNFKRRFYFVQDYEPSFYPVGAFSLAAEQTYKKDLDCICASPWLSKLMEDRYGRWARPFWLAADTGLYHPPKKKKQNRIPRIAFYSRYFTARRAVELGFLALEILADRGVKFEVDFFGADLGAIKAPFKFRDHGVAVPDHLSQLFQASDLGVVFSATNYSLVPQEMMACGLPIIELKGESTECIFPSDTVSLAEPNPEKIADAMEAMILSPEKREKQQAAALEWVRQFTWEKSARIVENALVERLAEFATPEVAPEETYEGVKASVVIPTYNAGPKFQGILEAVTNQVTPWPFEVLVIDSGSTDSTLKTVKKFPSVKLHSIEAKDFNHGATRNLGVELTEGEFVAFLTHDALPADNRWLYKLVTSLERDPKAAGAFGCHLPYPSASPFTKRDLNQHFANFNKHPLSVSKYTEARRYRTGKNAWRQFLHFYSDNNSCMRRSVWEKIPYRAIQFGEDQVWADDIIKAGYNKVYSPRARVYHSHDFSPEESYERNRIESAFFKHFFGYRLIKDQETLEKTLKDLEKQDREWAKANHVSAAVLKKRLADNEARLKGYLDGANMENTSEMFD